MDSSATDYTFTLSNAINTALAKTFVLRKAPMRNKPIDIQAGDIYYSNGMWSRNTDKLLLTTIGYTATGVIAPVAAKESGDTDITSDYIAKPYNGIKIGDIYYSTGFWSPGTSAAVTACKTVSTPVALVYSTSPTTTDSGLGFHAYAMALKDASSGCQWSTTETSIGVFNVTAYTQGNSKEAISATASSFSNDRDGYTKTLAVMGIENWETLYPAFSAARNYSEEFPGAGCSGWFLPTVGQMKDYYQYICGFTDNDWYNANQNGLYKTSTYNGFTQNFISKMSTAGLALNTNYTYFFENATSPTASIAYWLSSEYTNSYAYTISVNKSDVNVHMSPEGKGGTADVWKTKKTGLFRIRSVLAF